MDCFWPWNEIKVGKDKADLLTEMTPSEKHGVITTLKLFLKYELFVGNEYWLDRVIKKFPRPEIQRMCAAFGHVELNSHAMFYNEINKELGIANDEFYTSYVDDKTLADRINFIDSLVNCEDDLLSIAGFSMVEGAVLYSSFAYLKHFQSKGKNKILNIVRGINMSSIDEHLHHLGGCGIFLKTLEETNLAPEQKDHLHTKIKQLAYKIFEHESRIIQMIFEKGPIDGITAHQLEEFVKSRLNICLENLQIEKVFDVKYNPIATWFYDSINNYSMNDFFSGIGSQYTRGWVKQNFTWETN